MFKIHIKSLSKVNKLKINGSKLHSNMYYILIPFHNECHFNQKNCFKMNVTLHFQYNFNFFLSTLHSINTPTFLSHNYQFNFSISYRNDICTAIF